MSAHLDPDNLPAGEMVDGWRVVRRLGGGAYGTTYQVEKAGAFFALKVAHHRAQSGDERQTDERTQREIACLLSLRHRHIVRVWAHGRWPHPQEGWLYLVMDYVEGATLAQWQEQARPTAHEVAALFAKVLEAVAAMHAQGILHRDLKPDNLLVDKQGQPVVVDYGAAHSPVAPRLTKRGLPPGTPRYTSPEAARFELQHRHDKAARYPYTVADELYALGVTLYDVLTDPQPWSNPQPLPVGLPYPPDLAHEVNERVPPALSHFTARLLSREPEQRPESAERARRDIADFAALATEEWRKRSLHPPAPVEPKLAPGAEAGAPAPQWQAPPTNSLRRRRWRALGVGLGLTLLAAGGAALALRGGGTPAAQPPPAPAPVAVEAPTRSTAEPAPSAPMSARLGPAPAPAPAPPSPPTPPQEKGPTVKARPTPSTSAAPHVCSRKEPPPHGTPAWRAWCQCASLVGTLAAFQAGCSGPQVRPGSEPCPQEALDVMKQFHPQGVLLSVCLDPTQRCARDNRNVWVKSGPLTSRVFDNHDYKAIPEDSLLFGEVKITGTDQDGAHATVRYTLIQFPDGKKYPVCIESKLGSGVPAKPGAVRSGSNVVAGVGDQNGWEAPW